jgi:hypothetical protein
MNNPIFNDTLKNGIGTQSSLQRHPERQYAGITTLFPLWKRRKEQPIPKPQSLSMIKHSLYLPHFRPLN